MSILEAVVLALVQGLTEFLPISSDGHLALAQLVMGSDVQGDQTALLYDIVLHVATSLAVAIYFRRELKALLPCFGRGPGSAPARRVMLLLVAASIPTAAVGFSIRNAAEAAMDVPALVALGFLGTSIAVASTARLLRRARTEEPAGSGPEWIAELAGLRMRDAALIGVAQGLAVWPGLSRSGTTIATALWLGVPPVVAARFSFLALLPAIGGALLLEARHLDRASGDATAWVIGFAVAFAVGLLAIRWLVAIVRNARLPWFAAYTFVLAIAVLVLDWAR